MIYDDQPQMVDVLAEHRLSSGWSEQTRVAHAGSALKATFAAIDREALIEKASEYFDTEDGPLDVAEKVLIAAGIIPERDG